MNSFSKTMTAIVKKFPPVLFALVLSLVASSAFALLPQPAYANPDPGWLSGWAKRVKLTIDYTDIDSALSDFPILVYLSTSSGRNSDDVSFVFDELQSDDNRKKIAVTQSDGTTECKVEIEKWVDASEKAWLWVKVPAIADDADTDLYLYYDSSHADNDTYVSDTNSTPAENVWSNGYEAVYHLNNHFLDSTDNSHDATDSGSDDVEGRIGRGRNIDPAPDDHIDLGNWSVSGHEFTMQLWAYYDTFQNDARSLSKAKAGSTDDHVWMLSGYGDGETRLRFRLKTGTSDSSGTTTLYDSESPELDAETWYLIACTYDGANMRIILNGIDIANVAKTGELRENAWDIFAGTNPVSLNTMDGRLDEVRISSAVRSPDWLAAEYETGRDHLLDWGSEETPPTANVGADQEVCAGVNLALNGNPSGGTPPYTHSWTGDTAPLSATNVVNPTFNSATPGTYNLTYTVTDSNGLTGSDSLTVTVNANPTANVGADQTICAGVNLALNGNPSGGTPPYTSHSWTGDTAPLSATNVVNPTFNSATPGTYNLTYTVTDSNGCQGSDSIVVTVKRQSHG